MLLTSERLRSLLVYSPETGDFTRLVSLNGKTKIGEIAGYLNSGGYKRISVDGVSHSAHRLAVLYITGIWPQGCVDHVNRDPSDNRWCNLRDATLSQNQANTVSRKNSSSHFLGVSWNTAKTCWVAQITTGGSKRYLGGFDTEEQAALAYDLASIYYFREFSRPNFKILKGQKYD